MSRRLLARTIRLLEYPDASPLVVVNQGTTVLGVGRQLEASQVGDTMSLNWYENRTIT